MSSFVQTAELHRFVYDEEQVKRFANFICSQKGVHQLFINARPKYQTEEQKIETKIKHAKNVTKSFNNVTPEQYLALVKSFEQRIGTYDGHGANCLVIYGTTNPRDAKKASKQFAIDVMNAAFTDDDFTRFTPEKLNSYLMASKGSVSLVTMDIDDKSQLAPVEEFLKRHGIPRTLVETRGGYHVFIDVEHSKPVFLEFSKLHTMGDTHCSVPGTYQGGFPVRFVD